LRVREPARQLERVEKRATYERKMLELVCKMSNVLSRPEREQRAWSIIA